jgi:putative SOS response-associated peptidase YedK
MCGRFTLKTPAEVLAEHFDLIEVPELGSRYNVAPSQPVPVVRLDEGVGRNLALLRWGLIPAWADDPAIGNRLINARAETVADKPAFRHAFKAKRCLVVADGFFEWSAASGKGAKVPHYFALRDGGPFAFAGLWERWSKGTEPVETCTLLTTEANAVVAPVHGRMPLILAPGDYERWLDPGAGVPALQSLLRPYPADAMTARPVGRWVNDPKHDDPRCVETAG